MTGVCLAGFLASRGCAGSTPKQALPVYPKDRKHRVASRISESGQEPPLALQKRS